MWGIHTQCWKNADGVVTIDYGYPHNVVGERYVAVSMDHH